MLGIWKYFKTLRCFSQFVMTLSRWDMNRWNEKVWNPPPRLGLGSKTQPSQVPLFSNSSMIFLFICSYCRMLLKSLLSSSQAGRPCTWLTHSSCCGSLSLDLGSAGGPAWPILSGKWTPLGSLPSATNAPSLHPPQLNITESDRAIPIPRDRVTWSKKHKTKSQSCLSVWYSDIHGKLAPSPLVVCGPFFFLASSFGFFTKLLGLNGGGDSLAMKGSR